MSKARKPKIIAVVGPTAGGKSDLAVEIAQKFNGEVISADSRQIYRGLNIGSGKITKREMKGIPHHLLDVASPKRTFTVARFKKLAEKVIAGITKRGKLPVICGGTGLYINALIGGWSIPSIPPDPKLRARLEKITTKELFEKLFELDKNRAKNIDRFNRRRLIRALEIVITTGKAVPPLKRESRYIVLKIGVAFPPEELKKRITLRLKRRFKEGMIGEVEKLRREGVGWKRLDDLGLEYRWISRYLRGAPRKMRGLISRKEMEAALEKEIIKYAKRQITWFKRDKEIIWLQPADIKKDKAFRLARRFLLKY
ncbi:MAG: tRNA (adenosine(37)-N6)-dimethylallyltransferase MiaA [Parcubacteria group bacterium]|nr:tRNA (adenosine(37)-N6)-dimethylallyltransferase MiaA [Parcubacteria group bacterium]